MHEATCQTLVLVRAVSMVSVRGLRTFLKGRPEDTMQYTWPGHIVRTYGKRSRRAGQKTLCNTHGQNTWSEHTGNVPEGQKSGPFRNTRQPQPIEHKRCTDIPRSRRADKITLWVHPTGYTAPAGVHHRYEQSEHTTGRARIHTTIHMTMTQGKRSRRAEIRTLQEHTSATTN